MGAAAGPAGRPLAGPETGTGRPGPIRRRPAPGLLRARGLRPVQRADPGQGLPPGRPALAAGAAAARPDRAQARLRGPVAPQRLAPDSRPAPDHAHPLRLAGQTAAGPPRRPGAGRAPGAGVDLRRPRPGPEQRLVLGAVLGKLGPGRPLPADAGGPAQRPRHPGPLRRAGVPARERGGRPGSGTHRAQAAARAARALPPDPRGGDRPGPVHPAPAGGQGAGRRHRARGHRQPGPARQLQAGGGLEEGPRLRLGDRRGLFAPGGALGQLHPHPGVEQDLPRRAGPPPGQAQGSGTGPRSGLRALPPQPHGLPAAVLPAVRTRHRAAAHRRRHQPQPAGGGHHPAQGRGVLHAPQLPRQSVVLGGVHRVRGPAGVRRLFAGVLHRRRALAHRPAAAAQGRHDRHDRARLAAPAHPPGAVPAGVHRLRAADGRQQLPGRTERQAQGEGIDLVAAVGHPQGAALQLRPGGGELRRADRAQRHAGRTRPGLGRQAAGRGRQAGLAGRHRRCTGPAHPRRYQRCRRRQPDQPAGAGDPVHPQARHGRGRPAGPDRAVQDPAGRTALLGAVHRHPAHARGNRRPRRGDRRAAAHRPPAGRRAHRG